MIGWELENNSLPLKMPAVVASSRRLANMASFSASVPSWAQQGSGSSISIDMGPNVGMSFWCILLIVAHQLQLQCLSRWDLVFLLAPCKGPIRVSRTDFNVTRSWCPGANLAKENTKIAFIQNILLHRTSYTSTIIYCLSLSLSSALAGLWSLSPSLGMCLHIVNVHHHALKLRTHPYPHCKLCKIIPKTVSTFRGSYISEVPVSTNDASTNFLSCDWTEVVNLGHSKQRTKREHNIAQ